MDRRDAIKLLGKCVVLLAGYATGCTNAPHQNSATEETPITQYTPEPVQPSASPSSPENNLPSKITLFNEHPIPRYSSLKEKLGRANNRWSENDKGERRGYVPMDHHWVEIYNNGNTQYILTFSDQERETGWRTILNMGLYSESEEDLEKIRDYTKSDRKIEGVHTIEQNGLPRIEFRFYHIGAGGRHPIDICVYSTDLEELFFTTTYEDSSMLSADITKDGQQHVIISSPSSSEHFQVYDAGFSRSLELERTMEGLYSNFSRTASMRDLGGLANFQNEFGNQLALACVRVFPVPNPKGGLMSFDSYVRQFPGFDRFEGTAIGRDPIGTVGRVLIGAQTPEDFVINNWSSIGFGSRPLYTPEGVILQDRGDVQEVRTQSGHVMWRNPEDNSYRYSVGGPPVTRDQRTVEIQHSDGSRTYEHRDPVTGRTWESNK